MSKIAGIGRDSRGSAPGEAENMGSEPLVGIVAEAAAEAARDALQRHRPDLGSGDSYLMARALWVAMGMLLGPESANSFIVFLSGQLLGEFEAKRKGVV